MHTYIHTYTYIHVGSTHTHIHTYIHTHIYVYTRRPHTRARIQSNTCFSLHMHCTFLAFGCSLAAAANRGNQSHLQGPPRHIAGTGTTCGLSQFTGHLWTYESLAGGNKRRLFAMDAYLTRGTVSRPPVAPCTTCLHHVCMVTWDLRSTS